MLSAVTDIYIPQALSEILPSSPAPGTQAAEGSKAAANKEESQDNAAVRISVSPEAAQLLTQLDGEDIPTTATGTDHETNHHQSDSPSWKQADDSAANSDENNLSPAEENLVQRLAARDREVRAHESRHLAAAGELAVGGAHYTYQKGPDGKLYAIGGHVSISTGQEADPEKARLKAAKVRTAAMAAGDASAADAAVAAHAGTIVANTTGQLTGEEAETSLSALAMKIKAVYDGGNGQETGRNVDISG